MRPAPHAAVRRDACLRGLVLLLVLLVPCAHAAVRAAPAAPVAAAVGAAGEYDHLDTVLRGPGRSGRQAVVVRPVAPAFAAGRRARLRFDARTDRAAVLPRGPRSVVLRC
ncbi:hypothetical protein ACQ9AR_18500 [Streptomyces lividans]|uniref:Secreted protein n=1 Tax=Streptomyces lividans TK24 TaxID=457428 RepID=A0ABM5R365_STRLI|nr:MULTISPECIES: hypothetical protein [Streptomyces]AIJ14594.1 putative secreted protein [Streptomyces lividans TK24]QSJ10131.1 putative secreted protein [Streptomyces lividans]QTD71055.1 putative secreted protein [Streptomyces lividans TK24] [Streptomyces lividans]